MWTRFIVWLGFNRPKPEPHGKCRATVDAWLASKPADIPVQPLRKYLITLRNGAVVVHKAHRYNWSRETNLRFYREGAVTFQPSYTRTEYCWKAISNTVESFVCRTASVVRVELIDPEEQ